MADRKILSSDFATLKAKVKAEMLRRSYSGSVVAYGGVGYDFATPPVNGGPLLGEHLKKNLVPMQAVNPTGLPTYPVGLTQAGQAAMETKITAWATRGITDRSATDCKSGCTGTCYTTCQTGCYTGCSGCSGCGSGCADDCDGCDGCSGGCDGCSGCGGRCSDSCTGCEGTCDGGCDGDCEGGCSGSCGSQCEGCYGLY